MQTKIVRRNAIQIVGLAIRTTNEGEKGAADIMALWQRFHSEGVAQRVSNRVPPHSLIGAYLEYENDWRGAYTFIAGAEVSSLDFVPAGLDSRTLPAAQYLVASALGPLPQALVEAWTWIWSENLPRSYRGVFELYDDRFTNDSHSIVDVHIAINDI